MTLGYKKKKKKLIIKSGSPTERLKAKYSRIYLPFFEVGLQNTDNRTASSNSPSQDGSRCVHIHLRDKHLYVVTMMKWKYRTISIGSPA